MTKHSKFWHKIAVLFGVNDPWLEHEKGAHDPPTPLKPAEPRYCNCDLEMFGKHREGCSEWPRPEVPEKVIKYRKPRRRVKGKPKPPRKR